MKLTAILPALFLSSALVQAAPLELKKGQHVCYIGNTLADRMQHFGWLETLIQHRFPEHQLTFRNLSFSGDELTLRLRSADFGSPDHWLSKCQADVIFAFFGYNESFAGRDGLEKFKKDLDAFVKSTLAQKYNGNSAPTLVLFSPIAHENLHSPDLPDGAENNERIKLYTGIMAEVAAANNVRFVDLFAPTESLYAKSAHPLTINGIHLTDAGYFELAKVIASALFESNESFDANSLAHLRNAVNEKNFYWFNRYRTVDGYSIFGGRADLRFVNGQTNRVVAQREMEILDIMTANRDKVVWAAAQGKTIKPDDSNTPDFVPVITNKPGPLPGGKHLFLGGEEAISKMTLGKNLKINLFASEEKWPELAKPVQMTWDAQGRLWVAVWPSYPHWKPKEEMNDKILIFEDTDGDGVADKMTVFADHLHCPTGFELVPGGVLVAEAPDLMLLKDTKGTGKADTRIRVLHGLDSADTHHTANSFVRDPGGAIYFQEGTFHHTQVETPYGPPIRNANAGVYRYDPRTQKFDVYITYGFANPHGHVFDHWGQDIVVDGTGANPYHAALFSGYMPFPQKHAGPPQVYSQRTRPCPGMEFLSSKHFPPEYQGNLLVANVIGFQGILRYRIDDQGSSFSGQELEPVLSSTDPNFRPSDVKIGPDGAIYFIDWHNPLIGHMQHNLRDPSRDRTHGRIYRITYEGRPTLKPPAIAGQPIETLLNLMKDSDERILYRIRIELAERPTQEVLAVAKKWAEALSPNDPTYDHDLLEVLWLHQAHNVVDVDLLKQVLHAKEFRARAAATRVLCYWRDRVPDALALVKQQAADNHPRVRLEAVRAASFFTVPEAAEVPVIASEKPSDIYLDFVRGETNKIVGPILRKALAENQVVKFTTEAGARFLLRNVSIEQLLKMKRTRSVNLELVYRAGVPEEKRREAVSSLARTEGQSEARVLIDAIRGLDGKNQDRDSTVVFDLVHLLAGRNPSELSGVRSDLEALATSAQQPFLREVGYVAMISVDGSTEKAWMLAMKSAANLRDLLAAVPLIGDPGLRATLYPKIEPLLQGLPASLGASGPDGRTLSGRYVRIELPGRQRTLTLAEVEVFSQGQNIARRGKARQKNTAYGGVASRAIDGKKSGTYGDGGQTHTQEGTSDPWWEVDLGAEQPIDSILVWNRTDGNLGSRLSGFTLKVLDKNRRPVFERRDNPAPAEKAAFDVSTESPEQVIRRSAMIALTSVRGQEQKTFQTLAEFIRSGKDASAAIAAIQQVPRQYWPKDDAASLVDHVLKIIRAIPTAERTTADALDALQFADTLASFLDADRAKKVRGELGELGVRVIRLHTLPERMSYDKDLLVVKAGKPVEFLFENTDLMPHNFVILRPGSLEEIGLAAEASATQPDAAARNYVPVSNKILLSSRLLQPRDSQKLSFTAPTTPGVYPFVCTYPGHWRRMYGALYVVADLDEYQANPEAYLAKSPLAIKDDLLKDRRPRTEWKFEDLSPVVSELKNGRSWANGKHLFQVASCISCHKLDGMGNEYGPDLTKLDPKLTPTDILKDIVEPSFRINEKYITYQFDMKSGVTFTGLILKETPTEVTIIENPLAKTAPRVIKVDDIETRTKSKVSLMPKGLLDKLTRDEILDLVAFIASRGNKNSSLFEGSGHDHAGHQH
jgi:putative heme-binding domain-containing protein